MVLLLMMAACSAHSADSAAEKKPESLDFTLLGTYPVGNDGRSELITLKVASSTELIAIRSTWPEGQSHPNFCFQLEEVRADGTEQWVGKTTVSSENHTTCSECLHRVYMQAGSGAFLFPNNGQSLPELSSLTFKVVLRDCLTALPVSADVDGPIPAHVVVETGTLKNKPAAAGKRLSVAIVNASNSSITPEFMDVVMPLVQQAYQPIGVDIELVSLSDIARPDGERLEYNGANMSLLGDLADTAAKSIGHKQTVPIILTPCLHFENPLLQISNDVKAVVPHIPGGLVSPGSADAVFVSAESCLFGPDSPAWLDADGLARILAHELGHFLGLYHVPDHLGTDPQSDNLMHPDELSVAFIINPTQADVIRRHPWLKE